MFLRPIPSSGLWWVAPFWASFWPVQSVVGVTRRQKVPVHFCILNANDGTATCLKLKNRRIWKYFQLVWKVWKLCDTAEKKSRATKLWSPSSKRTPLPDCLNASASVSFWITSSRSLLWCGRHNTSTIRVRLVVKVLYFDSADLVGV